MPIALCTLELFLPYAQSLKEKRMILRKAQDRLRSRFNFAIAEIDHHDLWQRATLGAVTISGDRAALQRIVDQFIEESVRILGDDLIDYEVEYLD